MSQRKATPVNINDDPLKAAKVMKKILSSEDAYDKAANCYLSKHGGMFGQSTIQKVNELFAIEAAQRRSERSSFRRHDSRQSLREKKKKNKWITIKDNRDRDIKRQLAQMEADRNETDSRLNHHRQSTYNYSSNYSTSYNYSSNRDQPSTNAIVNVERQFTSLQIDRSYDRQAICYHYSSRQTNQRAIQY
uniref:Uncharacterized protein n=1 Tax=Plectus sambesii TaxID=2011161 RepID=A0A914WKU9_9BILA